MIISIKERMLAVLIEEKSILRSQINHLQIDLKAIDRVIARIRSNKEFKSDGDTKLKLGEAIKQIINLQPDKIWTPVQVRNELVIMQRRGTYHSPSKNILPAVHVALKRLVNKQFVNPVDVGQYLRTSNDTN